ncbi:deubiquitinase OTUD6B [Trifolium repens]|nr:deubiquitinase OTUD6B [Trifolium repens]
MLGVLCATRSRPWIFSFLHSSSHHHHHHTARLAHATVSSSSSSLSPTFSARRNHSSQCKLQISGGGAASIWHDYALRRSHGYKVGALIGRIVQTRIHEQGFTKTVSLILVQYYALCEFLKLEVQHSIFAENVWNSSGSDAKFTENSVTGLEFIRYEFGILASFGGITGAAQVSITGACSDELAVASKCSPGRVLLPV